MVVLYNTCLQSWGRLERYQLLVENTELQKAELQQVRERNAVLQEQQGRQELATRKVSEQHLA